MGPNPIPFLIHSPSILRVGPPDVNRKIELVAKFRVRLIGVCHHESYLMAYHWVIN